MADFEVLGHYMARHAGHDADEFVESLRLALDCTMSDASLPATECSHAG